jgi:hypothetical protein
MSSLAAVLSSALAIETDSSRISADSSSQSPTTELSLKIELLRSADRTKLPRPLTHEINPRPFKVAKARLTVIGLTPNSALNCEPEGRRLPGAYVPAEIRSDIVPTTLRCAGIPGSVFSDSPET